MSTKIYNGYRTDRTIGFMSWLNFEFRLSAQQKVRDIMARKIADMIVEKIDEAHAHYHLSGDDAPSLDLYDNPFDQECKRFEEEYMDIKKTGFRNPLFDMECEISILFPKDDANKDKILLIVHSDQSSLVKLFEDNDFIEDYAFWNNTDPPEDISKEDWDARGKAWNAALGKTGVPARNGMTWELIGRDLPRITREEVMEKIPSFETRSRRFADNQIVAAYFKANPDYDIVRSCASKFLTDTRNYKKSAEGRAEHARLIEQAKSILPIDIDEEHLDDPFYNITTPSERPAP